MIRDHQGITLTEFNGLWSRGDVDSCPLDHFSDCQNIRFIGDNTFGTRPGIDISQDVFIPLANIKRIYNYPLQTANTLIVLVIDEITGNGEIYHVINSSTVYGPILTIAGMTDFAFVPYAGRAYISPFSSSQLALNPPTPLTAVLSSGTGLGVGIYSYAVTFVNATGESTPSALTTVTTNAQITAPVVTPILTDVGVNSPGNALVAGDTYKWLFTFVTATGRETTAGAVSLGFVAPIATHQIQIASSGGINPSLYVSIYRTVGNGATYYLEAGAVPVSQLGGYIVGQMSDAVLVAQVNPPVSNNTAQEKVNLSSIPISSSSPAIISGRNIYRTAVNGTQLKLLIAIADDTTTTYVDTTADVSLGANAPTANTAFIGTNIIEQGLSGQFVYVYAGDGTAARQAAGVGMSGTMSVANGQPGFTDVGFHIFGIVSETISGYLSPPTILTGFNTNGANSVSFGSIPTSGNPNVIARLLVSTIAIPTFNGNLEGYQFFFVPNGVINNNTDTFLNNISFYDADLLEDASYLLNNYTAIPAGAVLSLYHNRLIVAATATDISLALVSQPGEPEAVDQVSGLLIVPLDGNPITNAQEYLDTLYLFKRARTVGFADNGGDPSSWPMTIIDNALGTSVHGIATVLDSGTASVTYLIICTLQGISLFNGAYVISMYNVPTNELTWKIEDYWKSLNRNSFGLLQLVNAPIQKEIYVVLPNGIMLVGNYANGLDYKKIKWVPWVFPVPISTVAVYNVDEIVIGAVL